MSFAGIFMAPSCLPDTNKRRNACFCECGFYAVELSAFPGALFTDSCFTSTKKQTRKCLQMGYFLSVYYGADAKVLAAGDLRFFHDRGDVVISPILARYPAIPISEAGLLWCTGYSVQSTDEWH
jgi:hypothetical protein